MPSSYTSSLGLEKPGSGEQTGSWGNTVNENMDIIDVSVNGVKTLSLSGTSSTLTTTDGVISDGHYKVLVLGGTPSGTHTITLSPNTAQKLYFVNNTTAQSVIVTQGSGGNATITAGETAIIYANGAGAGSAVVNLSSDFGLSSPEITGGTINGAVIGGTTPAAGTFAGLTATGTVNLTGATVSNGGTVTTVDINGGTADGVVIGGTSPAAATVTTLTASGAATLQSTAQITGAVGIGGAANASAQLDVASTTKGLLVPRMTTTQRNAIASPAAGLVIYNTTTARYNINNGAWVELPLVGTGGAQAQDGTLDTLSALSLVAGDLLYATGADTLVRLPKASSAFQVLRQNSGLTAPEWGSVRQTSSVATTTSLTEHFLTGVPTTALFFTLHMYAVSLSGTDGLYVQLLNGSGTEITTGYIGTTGTMDNGAVSAVDNSTSAFAPFQNANADNFTGRFNFARVPGTNLWVQDHTGRRGANRVVLGGGRIDAATDVTGVRIASSGSNTFDNGSAWLSWEA